MKLDLSKDEKKEIKKELAFLTRDKQNDYMKELYIEKKNKLHEDFNRINRHERYKKE